MASRRMFSIEIAGADRFLEMPLTTQALYFHLGLYADDDGFIAAPKKILRMIGAQEDDLRVLVSKSYVIPFDSGVIVITNWKENNFLRSDRYKPTRYQEEYKRLSVVNGVYQMSTVGIPDVTQTGDNRDTQVSADKIREDKDSKEGGAKTRRKKNANGLFLRQLMKWRHIAPNGGTMLMRLCSLTSTPRTDGSRERGSLLWIGKPVFAHGNAGTGQAPPKSPERTHRRTDSTTMNSDMALTMTRWSLR
ncbi:MAG: hypothetical protein LUF34_09230 [Lachnospiraceae bacterium]|nr:hypothetical protein [Lachnospiraceae bacterium]